VASTASSRAVVVASSGFTGPSSSKDYGIKQLWHLRAICEPSTQFYLKEVVLEEEWHQQFTLQ
jgi:hypothetical protein